MAETYYLPRRFELTSPWSAYIRVTDAETGQVLDKIDTVDMDAGTVEFQHWNEETGGYAPRLEKRRVELAIAAGAPKGALEWWKIPLGKDLHVEVTR
jgi:hypothetical protein